ncbi:hypothetical protein Taro_002894 [Colocasia esculenta]|uniref:Uncharacterized protein n=1 Tax=Colocasia esculenta TaxID=4460 RepID=A0A843TE07_COLES|nr:hypothetical protein [Colocasia esculenta]
MLRTQSKNMKNWSSSVDTSSSSVDTRDRFQKTFWPTWDSVSTLDQVAADTTGKKNGLVWMISCSPATKNLSTRPQQVLILVPRVSFYDSIKASLTPWYILSSTWLVLHHWAVRNTVVTTTTSQACPELLPAFLSSVSWFITELAVLRQLPTFHFDSFVSRSISSSNWPLFAAVKVIIVATQCWSSIRCSLLDKDRLRVVLAPHALYFGHGVFYQLSSLDHLSVTSSAAFFSFTLSEKYFPRNISRNPAHSSSATFGRWVEVAFHHARASLDGHITQASKQDCTSTIK